MKRFAVAALACSETPKIATPTDALPVLVIDQLL